ncbi:uncharacterized protein BJ212DRAFT_490938 [Suillus subaureus]|uniref:Uncharacterized protein n=1 Tax=Suillus subaureus TaxID=48587 RepID=A0A9P7JB03_9AGAM|nr:uncharacterized protein BJ212DRAFT_490938 [Suillus subaureus]KAG1811803.1 hypothetical protein BJ212DRAFT_490938 [Suillus subaureus]
MYCLSLVCGYINMHGLYQSRVRSHCFDHLITKIDNSHPVMPARREPSKYYAWTCKSPSDLSDWPSDYLMQGSGWSWRQRPPKPCRTSVSRNSMPVLTQLSTSS